MNRTRTITLLTILSLFGVCCSPSKNDNPLKYSDALIVLKGAKGLFYSRFHGTDQLFYKINATYPANQEINGLYEKLEAKGWRPLKEDYLNPGLPSSHVRGWTDFIDGTKKPERQVHQWLAQWESMNKDILWCTLRYSYPEGKNADLDNLEVSLIFIPAKLAIEYKKLLLENNLQNKNMDCTK
jgi:hypothetical protein